MSNLPLQCCGLALIYDLMSSIFIAYMNKLLSDC